MFLEAIISWPRHSSSSFIFSTIFDSAYDMVRIATPMIIASLAFTMTPSVALPVFEDGQHRS
jgi:hypothetical protein